MIKKQINKSLLKKTCKLFSYFRVASPTQKLTIPHLKLSLVIIIRAGNDLFITCGISYNSNLLLGRDVVGKNL